MIGVGFNSLLITPGTFPCRSTNHRFTRKTALQPSQKVDLRCLLFKFRIRSFLEETHTHTNAESLVECLEMQSLAEECHLFPSRGHGLVRSLRSPERGCQQCLGLSAVYQLIPLPTLKSPLLCLRFDDFELDELVFVRVCHTNFHVVSPVEVLDRLSEPDCHAVWAVACIAW